MASLGPYASHRLGMAEAILDGRSKPARLRKATKVELLRLLGHAPNVAELAVIEQMSWLTVRIAALEAKMAAGTVTHHDSNIYLAHCHQFTKHAQALGLVGLPDRGPRKRRGAEDLSIGDLLRRKEAA